MESYKKALALALALLTGALATPWAQASYLHVRPAVAGAAASEDEHRRTPWHEEREHGTYRGNTSAASGYGDDGRHCKYDANAGVVYEDVEMVMTETHFTDWFYIGEAGTYEGTLTDFSFPASFSAIGLSIGTSSELLAKIEGPGTFAFDAEPGRYFLSLFAKTDEVAMFGQYGIKIVASSDGNSPVPLPSGVFLFGSVRVCSAWPASHDPVRTKPDRRIRSARIPGAHPCRACITSS